MNTKRTLRILHQIAQEYDEGGLLGSMRQFVSTLRNLLVEGGTDSEAIIKQSLRVLLTELDRSPLNLIPERHLEFLQGITSRSLVGSGLKRTVTELISEGSYTKTAVLQQFSSLLSDMLDFGGRLKNLEHHLQTFGLSVEEVANDRALVHAAILPESITSEEYGLRTASMVEVMRSLCALSGGRLCSVEVQAEDRCDSTISFTVERTAASLFCILYLGILDTYAYISNFDAQISKLKSLRTSQGVIRVLEKEKKRMLNERLVVATNIVLSEFFKHDEYEQETFEQTYELLISLVIKIEEGFEFDVELGPQPDLTGHMDAGCGKLVQYLYAINKLFNTPKSGIRHLLYVEDETRFSQHKTSFSDAGYLSQQPSETHPNEISPITVLNEQELLLLH